MLAVLFDGIAAETTTVHAAALDDGVVSLLADVIAVSEDRIQVRACTLIQREVRCHFYQFQAHLACVFVSMARRRGAVCV